MGNKEIECRFLEIDKEALIGKLRSLGAKDLGEKMLEESIIYDPEAKWRDEQRFVRLRKIGDTIKLSYKEHNSHTIDGTLEIEFPIGAYHEAELLFEKIGLKVFRHQQKLRHSFVLDGATFDIDTWPRVPTYVELEGNSEEEMKKVATKVGLNWEEADFHNARWIIENKYKIPVGHMKWFTFDRFE